MVSLCLGASLLLGCSGSQFTGSLVDRSNGGGGGGPQPSPGQAQVSAVSPASVAAGSPSFSLTVSGVNFKPTTTVMWDSTPLVTTYISPTVLQAQVPTSLIGSTGIREIIPSPVGTFSYGARFIITAAQLKGNSSFAVSTIPVQANDMVWSPADSKLYVAVSRTDVKNPDTVASLDPQTGQFGLSTSTNSDPSRLAISADGTYLYASFDDSFSVSRYTLPAIQPDISFPLGIGSNTNYVASNMLVQPTNAHALAVARIANDSRYPDQGDVVIYDDTDARSQAASSGTNLPIDNLLWNSDGQTLYGFNSITAMTLYVMSADSTGVAIASKPAVVNSISGNLHFDSVTGYIYTDNGYVLDSKTAVAVGRFPVNALQSGFSLSPLMIPDSKLNIAYFLGHTIDSSGPSTYVIEAFDFNHYNLLGTATIPNVSGIPYRFVRWGSNGLAFLTTDPNKTGAATGIYLVSGAFVTSPAP